MSYDPECLKLATHFLSERATERIRLALAQHIQDSIEEWLRGERDRLTEAIVGKLTKH